jgi:chromosome segregation ATPase
MLRIDPLYLLLLSEAALLLGGGVLFLLYRLGKSGGRAPEKEVLDISQLMEALNAENEELEGRKEVFEDERTEDTNILLHRKTFQFHHAFIREMTAALEKKGRTGIENLTEYLVRGIRETINRGILWVKEIIEEKERTIEELRKELTAHEGVIEQMKAAFIKQKHRIADLLSSQEMLRQIQKRFDFLRDRNSRLKEKLQEALSNQCSPEESSRLVEELEAVNHELELCIKTLEKENQRLQERLGQYESGINELEGEFTELLTVPVEQTSADGEVESLRQELSAREEELQELRKEMEDLEREYLVLYKQVNS